MGNDEGNGACAGASGPVISRPPGQQHWADLV